MAVTPGCVMPTVSLHSFREVEVRLAEADSGKALASEPFRVHYESNPCDSPVVYHLELRTPREVRAKTDEEGKAVVRLADYAWDTLLEVNDNERGYRATFALSKKAIRKGGVVEPVWRFHKCPRLRLELQPMDRSNAAAPKAAAREGAR